MSAVENDKMPVGERRRWEVVEEFVDTYIMNRGIYNSVYEAIGRAFSLADEELKDYTGNIYLSHIKSLEADAGYGLYITTEDVTGSKVERVNYYILEVIDYIY